MAKFYETIDARLKQFLEAQKIFFVATAPLSATGHVNTSPKGYDSFTILDETTVVYLDLGGSGAETLAHIRENQRITLMFCAFEGAPNIARLYGRGEAVSFDEPGFKNLLSHFPKFDRARSIIKVNISKVQTSCGYGVPFYSFAGERDQLQRHVSHMPLEDWKTKRYNANATSLDGLPALEKPSQDG